MERWASFILVPVGTRGWSALRSLSALVGTITQACIALALVWFLGGFAVSTQAQTFRIISPDVEQNHFLGERFIFHGMGCTGGNLSPALEWSDAPAGTKSFALMVHDPDAKTGVPAAGTEWFTTFRQRRSRPFAGSRHVRRCALAGGKSAGPDRLRNSRLEWSLSSAGRQPACVQLYLMCTVDRKARGAGRSNSLPRGIPSQSRRDRPGGVIGPVWAISVVRAPDGVSYAETSRGCKQSLILMRRLWLAEIQTRQMTGFTSWTEPLN